ncbi:MAG: BBP7 family outer membrane beta-barrel protein [Pirellulales bacterium]
MNCKAAITITLLALVLGANATSVAIAREPVARRTTVRRGQPLPAVPENAPPADEPAPAADEFAPAADEFTPGMEPAAGEFDALEEAAPNYTETEPADGDEPASTELVEPGAVSPELEMFEGADPTEYQQRCMQCGCLGCECPPPVCPPKWYVEADAVWLQRNASSKRRIAESFRVVEVSGVPFIVTDERGNARSLNFLFEPGTRITVGRHLFRDFLERDHSLEGTYLGWYDWGTSQTIQGARSTTALDAFFGLQTGDLFVPFPTDTAGFGRADTIFQEYSSTFQNIELNYRVRRSLEQDRLVANVDGSWEREITPQGLPSFLMGFRYIEIEERYHLQSNSNAEIVLLANNAVVGSLQAQGDYRTRTTNRLFGFQIGGDWVEEHARFNWGGRGKFGLFGNAARLYSDITATPDISFAPVNPTRSFIKDRGVFSFIGEFGLMASWHVTPHLSLRAAYDWMWFANIAVAPEQLDFRIGGPDTMNTGGFRFLQGPSIGAQVVW